MKMKITICNNKNTNKMNKIKWRMYKLINMFKLKYKI